MSHVATLPSGYVVYDDILSLISSRSHAIQQARLSAIKLHRL